MTNDTWSVVTVTIRQHKQYLTPPAWKLKFYHFQEILKVTVVVCLQLNENFRFIFLFFIKAVIR